MGSRGIPLNSVCTMALLDSLQGCCHRVLALEARPRHSLNAAIGSFRCKIPDFNSSNMSGIRRRFAPCHYEQRSSLSGYGSSRVRLRSSTRQEQLGRLRAKFRFDSDNESNSRGGNSGVGRLILNTALTGALAYMTVTGKLGWIFDAILSLWLILLVVPLVAVVAYFWFVEREIVSGNGRSHKSLIPCPNCGNEFQVFEFAVKEELPLCPYCTQPFKVENRVFVRDEPRYSGQKATTKAYRPFDQQQDSIFEKQDSGGVIVDVEAEVLDD